MKGKKKKYGQMAKEAAGKAGIIDISVGAIPVKGKKMPEEEMPMDDMAMDMEEMGTPMMATSEAVPDESLRDALDEALAMLPEDQANELLSRYSGGEMPTEGEGAVASAGEGEDMYG